MRVMTFPAALLATFALAACGAPPAEDDASAGSADAVSVGRGRDVRCTTTVQGQSRTLRLQLGGVGAAGSARILDASTRSTPLRVATERENDDAVLVRLLEASGAPLATLRMPSRLWNDPSRSATVSSLPIFTDPTFAADVVAVSGPSWTPPRCELEWITSAPGVSSDLVIDGRDAERLFDSMNVPVQVFVAGETSQGRPIGSKRVEGPGLWSLECQNLASDGASRFAIEDSAPSLTCSFRMAAHVASRAADLTTYAMSLTEREKAGRLYLAFENRPLADGVGFEVRDLVASGTRGNGRVAGSRLRVVCVDAPGTDTPKTSCDVTLVVPPNP
jgi:hypothetical protein